MNFLFCWLGWHSRRPHRVVAYRVLPSLEIEWEGTTPRLVTRDRRYYGEPCDGYECDECGKMLVTLGLPEGWHRA